MSDWDIFIGPCAHGRDPWTRCDKCGDGTPVEALFKAWRALDDRVEKAETGLAEACGLAFDAGREITELARENRKLDEEVQEYWSGLAAGFGIYTASPHRSLVDLARGLEEHHQEHHQKEDRAKWWARAWREKALDQRDGMRVVSRLAARCWEFMSECDAATARAEKAEAELERLLRIERVAGYALWRIKAQSCDPKSSATATEAYRKLWPGDKDKEAQP